MRISNFKQTVHVWKSYWERKCLIHQINVFFFLLFISVFIFCRDTIGHIELELPVSQVVQVICQNVAFHRVSSFCRLSLFCGFALDRVLILSCMLCVHCWIAISYCLNLYIYIVFILFAHKFNIFWEKISFTFHARHLVLLELMWC